MISAMVTEAVRKKFFTIEEFERIEDAGIFPPDSRFELIRGEIIEMSEPTGRHIGRVNKLNRIFTSRHGETVIVSVQNPVYIRGAKRMSRPRPDLAILKPLPELFGPFGPTPDEVHLVIEISDTSERYDRKTKAPLYAEAGIIEYWILNIPQGVLVVRTEPNDGVYCRTEILKPGQTVSSKALPGVTFEVRDILE